MVNGYGGVRTYRRQSSQLGHAFLLRLGTGLAFLSGAFQAPTFLRKLGLVEDFVALLERNQEFCTRRTAGEVSSGHKQASKSMGHMPHAM